MNLHEQTTGGKNGYDLAANYNLGALALGAGYSQVDDDKQLGLRALYTFGQFVVGGYYQRNDENVAGSRNNFRLGWRLQRRRVRVPRECRPCEQLVVLG